MAQDMFGGHFARGAEMTLQNLVADRLLRDKMEAERQQQAELAAQKAAADALTAEKTRAEIANIRGRTTDTDQRRLEDFRLNPIKQAWEEAKFGRSEERMVTKDETDAELRRLQLEQQAEDAAATLDFRSRDSAANRALQRELLKTRLDAEKGGGKRTLTADQRNRIAAMKQVGPLLDRLEGLSANIHTAEGPYARFQGMVRAGAASFGTDTDASVYRSLAEGFLAQIARLSGEVGVLTEQDVKRASRLLPQLRDTKDEAAAKLSELRALLESRIAAIRNMSSDSGGERSITTTESSGSTPSPTLRYVPGQGLVPIERPE